jgi:hypothetical protein
VLHRCEGTPNFQYDIDSETVPVAAVRQTTTIFDE